MCSIKFWSVFSKLKPLSSIYINPYSLKECLCMGHILSKTGSSDK